MSNILSTLTALASGLASIAAIAGYHMLPVPGAALATSAPAAVADKEPSPAPVNPFATLAEKVRRWRRRHQAVETVLGLDDHLLRDIGLSRGIMISIKPADGRPRGLYADMIRDRLRHF